MGINASKDQEHAYRLDVNRNSSDGWVDDTDSQSLNVSASYAYRPIANMDVLLYSSYTDDNLPAYWGTPLVPLSDAKNPSGDVVSTDDDRVVDLATRYNNYNVTDSIIDSNSYWLRFDANWAVNQQTDFKASIYQFTAERLWQNAETYTYDASSQRVQRDRLLIKHQRYVRGLNLALIRRFDAWQKPQKLALNVITSTNDFTRNVGISTNDELARNVGEGDSNVVDDVDLFEPSAGNFGDVDHRQDKQTVITDALVIQYSIDLTSQWTVHSHVRFERIYFDQLYIDFDDAVRARSSLDKQFNQQRYFLGTTFKVIEGTILYVNVAQQQDPIDDGLTYFYDIQHLAPSSITQYEVGLKSIYNKATELSLAVYHINKDQHYQINANDAVSKSSLNSQGFEFAMKHDVSSI